MWRVENGFGFDFALKLDNERKREIDKEMSEGGKELNISGVNFTNIL